MHVDLTRAELDAAVHDTNKRWAPAASAQVPPVIPHSLVPGQMAGGLR